VNPDAPGKGGQLPQTSDEPSRTGLIGEKARAASPNTARSAGRAPFQGVGKGARCAGATASARTFGRRFGPVGCTKISAPCLAFRGSGNIGRGDFRPSRYLSGRPARSGADARPSQPRKIPNGACNR